MITYNRIFLKYKNYYYFFITFEFSIAIVWFIVIIGGEKVAKLKASYMLFFYTFAFGLGILFSIAHIKEILLTTKILEIIKLDMSVLDQFIIFIGFLIGF